jgi:hypothetical protein
VRSVTECQRKPCHESFVHARTLAGKHADVVGVALAQSAGLADLDSHIDG